MHVYGRGGGEQSVDQHFTRFCQCNQPSNCSKTASQPVVVAPQQPPHPFWMSQLPWHFVGSALPQRPVWPASGLVAVMPPPVVRQFLYSPVRVWCRCEHCTACCEHCAGGSHVRVATTRARACTVGVIVTGRSPRQHNRRPALGTAARAAAAACCLSWLDQTSRSCS